MSVMAIIGRRWTALKYLVIFAIIAWLLLYLNANYPSESTQTIEDHQEENGYKNSLSLRERLKPKLAKPFSPHPSALDQGQKKGSVLWDDVGAAHNAHDVKIRDEGYKLFAFNTLVSSRLSLDREIPDTRHKACRDLKYDSDLPSASIIICFYREDLSVLLRTVHSVVNRSPKSCLHEVILVNDKSDIDIASNITEHLQAQKLTHLVKLVTAPERLGLIRARIFGAKKATGQVLVFLDSHVEANVHWLEPLLDRIKENKTNVVTPIIDIVNADTFKYEPSPLVRGGFNWGLNFKWDTIPRSELQTLEDFAKPFKSPTMAGGLFAINREYFHELGEYDPGMQIWGGENLELSFKVWMCGGRLEIIPCSRVGHVFRKRRPYGSKPGEEDSMVRNSLRVANVWMDDYISNYYEVYPNAKNVYFGNITDRLELRKRLNCKTFKWYMDNVYPDLSMPDPVPERKYERWDQRTRNYVQRFALQLKGTKLCIQSDGDLGQKKAGLVLSYCLSRTKAQSWFKTDKNELILSKLLCLDATKKMPRLMKCHELGGTQEWKMREDEAGSTAVYNMAAGLCLSPKVQKSGGALVMDVCSPEASHIWTLIDVAEGEKAMTEL